MDASDILVFTQWAGMKEPVRMGVLHVTRSRGKEVFAFSYDPAWLKGHGRLALDPALQLFTGPQYLQEGQPNFGLFLDTAPDRWGRMLMQRREALYARKEKRRARTLAESDYLLGVHDRSRMGALRFKLEGTDSFLADDSDKPIPPMARLRELETASMAIEKGTGTDQEKWLDLLLAPGSSLGGARPKASVLDAKGALWIAKFPSRGDDLDKGAWEWVTHQLATRCGITTAPARVQRFKGPGHTFLTQRFDRIFMPSGRQARGERIHFASAMTMLQRADGDDAHAGASYLELAEFLMRHGAHTSRDLEQLWKRIVFNIRVRNTDDHLRNHGFLLGAKGWELSPAYDMNPEPQGRGLSLNIDANSNALSVDLVLEVAPYFRVAPRKAKATITAVNKMVGGNWTLLAKKVGIGRAAIERMEGAFAKEG